MSKISNKSLSLTVCRRDPTELATKRNAALYLACPTQYPCSVCCGLSRLPVNKREDWGFLKLLEVSSNTVKAMWLNSDGLKPWANKRGANFFFPNFMQMVDTRTRAAEVRRAHKYKIEAIFNQEKLSSVEFHAAWLWVWHNLTTNSSFVARLLPKYLTDGTAHQPYWLLN